MAAMNACTMAVVGAPQVAVVSSDKFASRSSVSFNNGGIPSMAFVRARSVRPLSVRAAGDLPGDSSTGGITDQAKEAAEKVAGALDGVKENVEESLTDGARELKSKTGDVVYSAQRNAEGVGNDAQQKANEAQTKFTKGQ